MRKRITDAAMLVAAFLGGGALAQPAPPRFGVVAVTPAHEPCVVLPSAVQVGQRITIARLRPPAFIPARIRNPVAECGVALEPGHAYALAIDEGQTDWWASTAVVGDVPPDLTFRECTGSESVHLTVWRGKWRLWHGYYYAGYDMEPTCAKDEVAD